MESKGLNSEVSGSGLEGKGGITASTGGAGGEGRAGESKGLKSLVVFFGVVGKGGTTDSSGGAGIVELGDLSTDGTEVGEEEGGGGIKPTFSGGNGAGEVMGARGSFAVGIAT